MRIRRHLPQKYMMLLIVLVSCADLFHYFILIGTAPGGYEFVGLTTDEAITFGLMNSPSMGYENPWNVEKGENIFATIALTTPYIYIPLGLLADFLNTTPFWMNALAKVVFNVIFFIVAYNFMAFFTRRQNLAMAIFLVVSGLSGIIYAAAMPLGKEALQTIGNLFGYYEFEKVTLLHYQLYYNLPKITGMLAIMAYSKRRILTSGALLGLTALFYPAYGFGFLAGIIAYAAAASAQFRQFSKDMSKILVLSAVFLAPWAYTYFSNPAPFRLYSAEYFSSAWLLGIYISFAMPLALAFYYVLKNVPHIKSRKFVAYFAAFSVVFSLYQIFHAGIGRNNQFLAGFLEDAGLISAVGFLNAAAAAVEFVSLLTFFFMCFCVYRSRLDRRMKFAAIWMLALVAFAVISPAAAFWFPQRMVFLLRLPITIMATAGLVYFAGRRKIPVNKVLAVLIILSLPSLVAAEVRYDRLGREDVTLYSAEDMKALRFLRNEPQGVVFSSPKMGTFGPSIANKKFVQFGWPTPIIVASYDEKVADYDNFYSGNYTGDRLAILRKYNASYVFFGGREASVSGNAFDPKVLGLQEIYGSGARIYRVSGP